MKNENSVDKISGSISSVFWRNDSDDFAIFKVDLSEKSPKDGSLEIVAKGNIMEAAVGACVQCFGSFVKDPKHGWQFKADSVLDSIPQNKKGIQAYLASTRIQGVGAGFAKKIVAAFGEDTWTIIDKKPWELNRIKGLGKKRAASLVKAVRQNVVVMEIMSHLRSYDISQATAIKIYKKWGASAIDEINRNPYALCEIPSVGFKTADDVAKSIGVAEDSPFRIKAGLTYVLETQASSGNTAILLDDLINKTANDVLRVDEFSVAAEIPDEVSAGNLKREVIDGEQHILLPIYYNAELSIVKHVKRLMSTPNPWRGETINIENQKLADAQKDAVIAAFKEKFVIVTGGPGVGKTTTVKEILNGANQMNAKVMQGAPTGRASRRMLEATGLDASTIHRLLGYNPDGGYKHNEENPLDCDIVIIDEVSMVDTLLMSSLLKAIPAHATIILIGDKDQLPSVQAGNVLGDLIASGVVPVVELTEPHRQGKDSQIIVNAYKVNNGQMPDLSNPKGTDFHFIEANSNEEIQKKILKLMTDAIPNRLGVASEDIQVLTPQHNTEAGTMELNKSIQASINPQKKGQEEILKFGVPYRVGDKVMQFKNDHDLDIFNGDVGIIKSIDKEDMLMDVDFEGRRIQLEGSDHEDIRHSFAATIHKSQGSEYKAVILPMSTSHSRMLNKNLLYTGMTRGKKHVFLVGSKKAIELAVSRKNIERTTGLKSKLVAELKKPDLAHTGTTKKAEGTQQALSM